MAYIPIVLVSLLYLYVRFTNIGVWSSDTNTYFYTAYQLLQGKLLYQDIFFTNLPFFPYVSTIYFYLVGKNLSLYYITASFEVVIIAFLLYKIIFTKTKDIFISTLCILAYMTSFIVLSTSLHQNGVHLASLFSIVAYMFLTKNKYSLSGFFIALSLLTKAYFIPIFLSFMIFLSIKKQKGLIPFLVTFFITALIIILPSIIFAQHAFINDLFNYSLTRAQQISKADMFGFFVTHDYLLTLLFIFSILSIRKYMLEGLISLFTLIFLILYKDTYYLYINICVPFLCISFMNFFLILKERNMLNKMFSSILVGLIIFLNITVFSSYLTYEKITSIEDIIEKIEEVNPQFLYGYYGITPALGYLTNTPLLDNIIDTNPNIFAKGILDRKKLTQEAITKKAIIVTQGTLLTPTLGDTVRDDIFDKEKLLSKCKIIQAFPIESHEQVNRINLWKCY